MNDVDGSIKLGLELEPKDIKKSSEELAKEIKNVFDSYAGKNIDKTFKQIQSQMSNTTVRANALRNKLSELESLEIPTQAYKELDKQFEKATVHAAQLREKLQGMKPNQKGYQKIADELKKAEESTIELMHDMKDMRDEGEAFTLGKDTAEYERVKNELAKVNNEMRILLEKSKQYDGEGQKIKNTASAFTKLNSTLKPIASNLSSISNKILSFTGTAIKRGLSNLVKGFHNLKQASKTADFNFGKLFKTLLKYGLGIRSLYVLVNKLRSALTEGMKNLVQYSDVVNKQMSSISTSTLSF